MQLVPFLSCYRNASRQRRMRRRTRRRQLLQLELHACNPRELLGCQQPLLHKLLYLPINQGVAARSAFTWYQNTDSSQSHKVVHQLHSLTHYLDRIGVALLPGVLSRLCQRRRVSCYNHVRRGFGRLPTDGAERSRRAVWEQRVMCWTGRHDKRSAMPSVLLAVWRHCVYVPAARRRVHRVLLQQRFCESLLPCECNVVGVRVCVQQRHNNDRKTSIQRRVLTPL